MSGENPRQITVQVLLRQGRGAYVEDLLEAALARSHLPQADRRLCQELVYGIVRWQATLDWLIARKTPGRRQKPLLQNLLRLGLYQIFWLDRIPSHAAVNETVELARQNGFGPQSGFVNAVLRGYLRDLETTRAVLAELKQHQPHLGYSHPEWLVARWHARWGTGKTAQLLDWNNTPPKTFARVNTLRADPGQLLAQWRDENVEYDFVRHDWLEENLVFEFKAHPPLSQLASFRQGFFYIQDPSTLLAVHELDPQPGETILDLCAAPGGKLTCIAQRMRNEGRLIAYDTSADRLSLVQANCARLGITCVEAVAGTLPGSQASEPTPSPSGGGEQSRVPLLGGAGSGFSGRFDRILIDAPCSNTGVMRRRVDLRWRIRPEEIERLRLAQLGLLRQAAPLVKPGGSLVYSTCSLEPEENRAIVEEFLSQHPAYKPDRERELLPFADRVDGAYVIRLARVRQNDSDILAP